MKLLFYLNFKFYLKYKNIFFFNIKYIFLNARQQKIIYIYLYYIL